MTYYPRKMTATQIIEAVREVYADHPVEQRAIRLHDLEDRVWQWANENKLNPNAPGWQYDIEEPPRYFASWEAAVSLVNAGVPKGTEGPDYILEHVNGGITIGARVGTSDADLTSWGETDAEALALAALSFHAREFGR